MPLRLWKVSFSLAVAAAITAPIALGTLSYHPQQRQVPISLEERPALRTKLGAENCGPDNALYNDHTLSKHNLSCVAYAGVIEDGFNTVNDPTLLAHISQNAGLAVITFCLVYLLSMAVPLALRRYGRWLVS